ncbi:hypothetical protein [Trichococcus alkaliphilus]|uniref:hypothetical protein n=1 Tax=Trichococcus alkaliphilus TaxID=2052943 RepID=UPI000D0AE240|nr:hypothetical protein [Trichococcus alkaliphilus]
MGHFGFSYVGLVFMMMLIVPNLIWTKYQPRGYDFKDENKVLLVFERVGQVVVTGAALVFSDFNIQGWSVWSFWLIAAFVLMILYECWWIRYFKSNRTWKDFYSSFYGIPVAAATLPVVAFFFLGLYGRVIWLMVSVIIFGIGHIGIHLQHRREMHS